MRFFPFEAIVARDVAVGGWKENYAKSPAIHAVLPLSWLAPPDGKIPSDLVRGGVQSAKEFFYTLARIGGFRPLEIPLTQLLPTAARALRTFVYESGDMFRHKIPLRGVCAMRPNCSTVMPK